LLAGLAEIPEIEVYGSLDMNNRLGLVSFNIKGEDPHAVSKRLEAEFGIMTRAGIHCAPQAHQLIGTEDIGTVRVSFGWANTIEEIDELLMAIRKMM
jgi:selenocysteine lyase/cysteine desulfurase